MPMTTQVEAAIEKFAQAPKHPEELLRLREFYDRMKGLGLAKKQEYDLPLIDTIGRSFRAQTPSQKVDR